MSYQYVVIPKNCPTPQSLEMYHMIYEAWLELWRGVFSEGNRAFEPDTDDFLRQDYVVGIFDQGNLVGFHLYSFFDLRKKMCTKHSYFNGIDPQSFEKLKADNINNVMTMEYLSVMPNYRKKFSNIPWGEVLIALGLQLMKTTAGDAAFGTARVDVKVDSMASQLGFHELQSQIAKYDYSCAVIACPKKSVREHSDEKIRKLIQDLWSNRIDCRNIQQNENLQVA